MTELLCDLLLFKVFFFAMQLISGLLRRGGAARTAVQELSEDLQGDGANEEVLSRCLECEAMEDVLLEELPYQTVGELLAEKRDNMTNLTLECLSRLERAMTDIKNNVQDGDSKEDETREIIMANCIILLTVVLSCTGQHDMAVGEGKNDSPDLCEPDALWNALWTKPEGNNVVPAGERLVDVAMNLLFLENFTVGKPDPPLTKKQSDDMNGVRAELLWCDGVGPECEYGQDEADKEMQENRNLVLVFLATILCGGAPVRATVLMKAREKLAKEPNKQKAQFTWHGPLIADLRALEYLNDSARTVPFRSELFYSLLSVVSRYDPRGLGIPYGGFFAGSKQEDNATLCLQVLGLLFLDAASRNSLPSSPVFAVQKPQEMEESTSVLPIPTGNFFGAKLRELSSSREISNLVGGVIDNLCMFSDQQSTYLPNSMKAPIFLPELMNLCYHLVSCDNFVKHICTEGDALAFLEGIVQVGFSAPGYVPEDSLWVLTSCTLLRFTSCYKVCCVMNEQFTGDYPDALPTFNGNAHDLVMLVALKLANEHLAIEGEIPRFLLQSCLYIVCNISVFSEELCMETCHRLFAFFERCAKSVHLKKGRSVIAWLLPSLLEAMTNIIQYQYAVNLNVIYGLLTRRQMLNELANISAEVYEEKAALVEEGGPETKEVEIWKDIVDLIKPIRRLVEAIAPELEAEVERKEISDPSEVKGLLPLCVLSLLPRPHAFKIRSVGNNSAWFLASERNLMNCLAKSSSGTWDRENEGKLPKKETSKPPKKAERSSSRSKRDAGTREPNGKRNAGTRETSTSRRQDKQSVRMRSTSRARRTAAGQPARTLPQSSLEPLPSELAATSATQPDPAAMFRQQLVAAAAQGVDIVALIAQLQGEAQPSSDRAGTGSGFVNENADSDDGV